MTKAESLYGQRDRSYTINDITITNAEQPCIHVTSESIDILLGKDCISPTDTITIFQLSHEIIHCLQPNKRQDVTYLEEGLAVYYSLLCSPTIHLDPITDIKYEQPYSLVTELLRYDNDIIKKARMYEPNLSKLTENNLLRICHNIPANLISKLTKKFY